MSDPLDLNAILGQAMEMQQQLLAAQAEAADAEVTGHAGGGAVAITVTGALDFRRVEIRPDAVDPDDVTMLEDLVLAALHDAMAQIGDLQQSSLGDLDLGGLPDLGGLGGFGGLGGPEADLSIEASTDDEILDAEIIEPGDDGPRPGGTARP